MSTFTIVQGDGKPALTYRLLDNGQPITGGLSAATSVAAKFADANGTLLTTLPVTITDAPSASLTLTWNPAALPVSTAGTYQMRTVVTWNDGTTETFPNGAKGHAYDTIVVPARWT